MSSQELDAPRGPLIPRSGHLQASVSARSGINPAGEGTKSTAPNISTLNCRPIFLKRKLSSISGDSIALNLKAGLGGCHVITPESDH